MLPPGTFLDLGNHSLQVLASPMETGDRYRLRVVAEPGGGPGIGSDAHVHPVLTETFTCLEGRMLARCAGKTAIQPVGERLEVPPGAAHGFINDGDGDLVVETEVIFDGGGPRAGADLLDFAAIYAGLLRDGRVNPRSGQPSLLQMAVLYRTYADAVDEIGPASLVLKALAPVGRLRGYQSSFPEYVGGLDDSPGS